MKTQTILGIKFITGTAAEVVEVGLRGGLVVVPSAPVLVDMADKTTLRMAVLGADLAITDSGLMVLLWSLLKGEKLERVSGLTYIRLFLERLGTRSIEHGEIFWIMPSSLSLDRNIAWLGKRGFRVTKDHFYVAPLYPSNGALVDPVLLEILTKRKPAHIIVALGGGVQERLGLFLKQQLSKVDPPSSGATSPYRPGIHCIGAAIGFLNGDQVRIPKWADSLYLGWLWRSISDPRRFVPRYWKALRLIPLMVRYGAKAPGAIQSSTVS